MPATPAALAGIPELRAIVGLFSRLLTAEPTLGLELPRLTDVSGQSADVLTMLTHSLDAAAMLPQPDLAIMGAAQSTCRA